MKQIPAKKLELMKQYAKFGEPQEQYELGEIFAEGKGVNKSSEEASKWFKLACGDSNTLDYKIGVFYETEKKSFKDAAQWFAYAAYDIIHEKSTSKNIDKYSEFNQTEVDLYLKPAIDGFAPAQHHLGLLFNCIGGSSTESKKWLKKAADQGLEEAKNLL